MSSNTCRFYDIGPFRFDVAKNFLLREGKRARLSPKASIMLGVLVRKHGELVGRSEILSAVWKKVYVEEGAVDHYVSELRKTFRVVPGGDQWIETVPRRGYRFVGPVRAVGTPPVRPPKVRALTYTGAAALACFLGVLSLGPRFSRPPRPKVSDMVALTHDGFAKRWLGLVMIGDQIYFSEVAGTSRTAHVSVHGGETVLNPSFAGFELQDVSPDGRQILATRDVGSNFELWILPAQGGTGRYLRLRGQEPTWSPDGGWIAYHDETHLWVARSDGSHAHILTTVAGVISNPHWSPDGRVIRFSVGDGTTGSSIQEIRADGTVRHELGPGLRSLQGGNYGRWTADGRWFVFEHSSSDHSELWARKEKCGLLYWQCGQLFGLTQGPVGYGRPLLSSDGKEIFSLGHNERSEVQSYDIHSRSFISFAALDGTPATQLDFSRDGKWMVYRNLSDHSIWRCKTDGSEKLRLTTPPLDAYQPHWSPDGRSIAFITADFKICLIPAAGGPVRPLAPGSVKQGVPTWSPDGEKLAYGEPLFKRDPADMQIHILDISGGRISSFPASSGLWTARWSPNGRFIAALTVGTSDERHSDSSELKLFDFGTGKWITLVKIHYINEPTWSQDSQFVYFDTASARDSALYRVRVSDYHLEKLASLNEITRGIDNWSGVASDGSPLIVKDTAISEIYAMKVDWP